MALSAALPHGAPNFPKPVSIRLVKRSEGDDEFALSVGSRSEIPRHHFLKLLTKASQAIRHKLETAHPQNVHDIKHVVAEVAAAIQAKAAAASRDYVAARALVESLRSLGQLNEKAVEGFARGGKFEMATAALAILCDLPIEAIERAMVQEDVGTTLIVTKAIGFSWSTAKAILLLRAGKRGIAPHELEQYSADFARLKRETAQQVINFQRNRQMAAPPTHRPAPFAR